MAVVPDLPVKTVVPNEPVAPIALQQMLLQKMEELKWKSRATEVRTKTV